MVPEGQPARHFLSKARSFFSRNMVHMMVTVVPMIELKTRRDETKVWEPVLAQFQTVLLLDFIGSVVIKGSKGALHSD